MYLLFTTPSCPQCPRAKEFLENKAAEFAVIDASQPRGLELARKYQLRAVPSLVEVDNDGQATKSFFGTEEIFEHFS